MEDKNKELFDWEAVFNAVDDAIFVADNNNNIVVANRAFAKIFNTEPDKVVGKKCYELMHKLNAPWPVCPFEKSKLDKKVHIEEVNDPNMGVPLLVTTSPIFNSAKEMIGVVHISKNISILKNAEEARRKTEEDLRSKLEELERFQKITVGRELKMKELKARISELEAKIGNKR